MQGCLLLEIWPFPKRIFHKAFYTPTLFLYEAFCQIKGVSGMALDYISISGDQDSVESLFCCPYSISTQGGCAYYAPIDNQNGKMKEKKRRKLQYEQR